MGVLSDPGSLTASREIFEKLYFDYNRRVYVSPDPLQFLYSYDSVRDREIAALIASSLAYGKVAQILKSVSKVLDVLGKSPSAYLASVQRRDLEHEFDGFVHRFTDKYEIVSFLSCISAVLKRNGTLEALFLSGFSGDMWSATEKFVAELILCDGRESMFLLPKPSKGSACKRLALFLRWMVRCDEVDPGGWKGISPSSLFVPLDTHMFQICSGLGLCTHKNAGGNAAKEITEKFSVISPEDPVRYDFAMTLFGIRSEMTHEELFAKWL